MKNSNKKSAKSGTEEDILTHSYRPLTDVAFTWHDESLARIDEQLQAERLPHGLLFRYRTDFWDDELGWRVAQHLLCDTNVGCGQCRHCRLFADKTHPNVLFLDITMNKHRKPTERLGIADIRQTEQQMWQTSMFDKPKVAFIHGLDLMSVGAQNALLKTLEEPPKNAYFILSCQNISRILPTILSRVQRLHHGRVTPQHIVDWLSAQSDVQALNKTEKDIKTAVNLAEAAPARAKNLLLDTSEAAALQAEKKSFAQFMQGKRPAGQWVSSLNYNKDKDLLAETLLRHSGYVASMIRLQSRQVTDNSNNLSENSVEYPLWHGVSLRGFYRLHDILTQMQRLTQTNVDMTLQLTSSLTDWQHDRRK